MSWSLSLSMVEARLPPGFRFHPRDDELVVDYLSNKLRAGDGGAASGGGGGGCPTLVDIDLNKCEPWDLPEIACMGGKEWYFYNLKDRKYARGKRTNRATESGYWKATGKDREITRKGSLVGMRKTLVFYRGRAPKGERTDWVMHEFRQELDHANHHHLKEDWVLCRVFYKSRTEAIAAPTMESTTTPCYINGDSSTPPLPPLVDNSISSFNHGGYYEEVACFSTSHHQPSPPSMNASAAADQDYHHLSEGQRHYSDKAMMRDLQNDQVTTRFDGLAVKREMSLKKKGLAEDEQVEDYYCLTDSGSSETWNLFQQ